MQEYRKVFLLMWDFKNLSGNLGGDKQIFFIFNFLINNNGIARWINYYFWQISLM